MKSDLITLSSAFVGIGMGIIYIVFLARMLALSNWNHISELQLTIFLTLALRLGIVIIFSKPIGRQPVIAYILLSFEVFLIPVFAILQAWTGNGAYTTLMAVTLTSWIGASAVLVSPYAIYEFARGMVRMKALFGVVAIGTFEVAGMLFLVSVVQGANSVLDGPSALGRIIIQTTSSGLESVTTTSLSSITLVAALVIFFLSVVAYISLGRVSLSMALPKALLIPLGGVVAAVLWSLALSTVTSNILFVFTSPILVGAAGMWVITRGN